MCWDIVIIKHVSISAKVSPNASQCFFKVSFIGEPLIGLLFLLNICNPSIRVDIPFSLPVHGIDIWKTKQKQYFDAQYVSTFKHD